MLAIALRASLGAIKASSLATSVSVVVVVVTVVTTAASEFAVTFPLEIDGTLVAVVDVPFSLRLSAARSSVNCASALVPGALEIGAFSLVEIDAIRGRAGTILGTGAFFSDAGPPAEDGGGDGPAAMSSRSVALASTFWVSRGAGTDEVGEVADEVADGVEADGSDEEGGQGREAGGLVLDPEPAKSANACRKIPTGKKKSDCTKAVALRPMAERALKRATAIFFFFGTQRVGPPTNTNSD